MTCETAFPYVVVSPARHFVLPCCEGFPMTLAQGLIAFSLICSSIVPSDDWTSVGRCLHWLIILTGGVSIDLGLKKNPTSLGRAIQRTLTILQLYLKTMEVVSLDESWSLRTKISGSDPQICPLSNSCGHSRVAFSKIIVEGQLLIWKPKMKPRMRLDSHNITGNENLYISF